MGDALAEAIAGDLFEIGPGEAAVADLRSSLGLDSGYLSRLLRQVESDGPITVTADNDNPYARRWFVKDLGQAGAEAMRAHDWDVPVPDLGLSVAGVVAHAAGDVSGTPSTSRPGATTCRRSNSTSGLPPLPDGLVATLTAYANVVAAVMETSPPTARGIHPMGSADPSGFAAMACDKLLIHTDDAARGLSLAFSPPPDLARSVLARLFPWVEPITEPWAQPASPPDG
ncbi:MAG: hypothetical protein ACFCVK_13005 [Acidimicrobiales bacterium]